MENNAIDFTGKTFGKLHVIQQAGSAEDGSPLWMCRCDCGNVIYLSGSTLQTGHKKSCGCTATKKAKDITGMKFGRLRAVKMAGRDRSGIILWECECDCGNTVLVRGTSLRSGNTRSCGCLRKTVDRHYTRAPHNPYGVTGVSQLKNGKWQVHFRHNGENLYLGTFAELDDAVAARRAAEEKYRDEEMGEMEI